MVANRLRYMWVLTLADGEHGAEGRAQCMRMVAAFAERLTAEFGRQPYWYSPEIHPGKDSPDGSHGWHINFFVGRYLPHHRVQEMWGHGIVWVKDFLKDSRVRSLRLPFMVAIRLGATYGCKYASKDWGKEMLAGGAHRYEIAQGFQPDEHTERLATLAEALAYVVELYGGRQPDLTWSSNDLDHWDGPPVYCFSWNEGLSEQVPDG